MNIIKSIAAILLLSLGVTGTALSTELPPYYPKTFDHRGTIDRISISAGELVIDDSMERFSINIKVHSLVTEHSSLRALQQGMKIGYTATHSKNGGSQITEIWVLPKNYSPSAE